MKTEKLYPVCKNYVWGGDRLIKRYGKTGIAPCAESWELSFHPDGPSRTADGAMLSEKATEKDLGKNCGGFSFFPMLIKLIDAKSDLSVQVHPSDGYALANENSFGKTETWYVIDAEPGACLYVGLKDDVSRIELEKAIADGTVTGLMNRFEVKPGESYFIPSGTLHAIGSGCLICEVQQNSNITYRVYDWGRVGADGRPRELHIKKALDVVDLKKYSPAVFAGENKDGKIIAADRYFTVCKKDVKGTAVLENDTRSFRCAVCAEGEGTLDGNEIKAGDSYFIPANSGDIRLEGDMTLIVSSVRRYALGVDLGGTFIKGCIADDRGDIIASGKTETMAEKGARAVAARIAGLCDELIERSGVGRELISGIGIGAPGMIDRERGEVVYSNNLKWEHFMIKDALSSLTGFPVTVVNDANAAALGEAKFGAGKGCKNTVMLTLGTGVGGGIILNGELFEGNASAGAELGHIVIVKDGERCTCGRKGCLEAYASATGLIRDTKRMMKAHPESKMNEISPDKVNGRTAFEYADKDEYAKRTVDDYLDYITCGVVDIANVFRPEAVLIGGGISGEGKKLTDEIQKRADRDIFGGDMGPHVKIKPAELGNKAGMLGAAALMTDN